MCTHIQHIHTRTHAHVHTHTRTHAHTHTYTRTHILLIISYKFDEGINSKQIDEVIDSACTCRQPKWCVRLLHSSCFELKVKVPDSLLSFTSRANYLAMPVSAQVAAASVLVLAAPVMMAAAAVLDSSNTDAETGVAYDVHP
jgi:hypothetical protein